MFVTVTASSAAVSSACLHFIILADLMGTDDFAVILGSTHITIFTAFLNIWVCPRVCPRVSIDQQRSLAASKQVYAPVPHTYLREQAFIQCTEGTAPQVT